MKISEITETNVEIEEKHVKKRWRIQNFPEGITNFKGRFANLYPPPLRKRMKTVDWDGAAYF